MAIEMRRVPHTFARFANVWENRSPGQAAPVTGRLAHASTVWIKDREGAPLKPVLLGRGFSSPITDGSEASL